jgi:energy-coupling factor transporter transmembrane protein EcfT
MRQVDQIATLIPVQKRAKLGGQQLFIREGPDIGLSWEPGFFTANGIMRGGSKAIVSRLISTFRRIGAGEDWSSAGTRKRNFGATRRLDRSVLVRAMGWRTPRTASRQTKPTPADPERFILLVVAWM